MTEAEWLSSAEPEAMLQHVGRLVTERKLRLFACACCRRDMPAHPQSRRALEVAERFAEGQASQSDLAEAWLAASPRGVRFTAGGLAARDVARAAADREALLSAVQDAAMEVAYRFAWTAAGDRTGSDRWSAWDTGRTAERQAQADLLREIVGNPFQQLAAPQHLPAVIRSLALSLDAGMDCAFALHDALLEAGNADLAGHFTVPAHPKGCWALDLLLGKA